MLNNKLKLFGVCAVVAAYSSVAFGHGYVDSPGARNYYCGAVTKPDEAANGTAEYAECGDAFANDFQGGYQYMSVLNHHEGRKVLGPVTNNVCGFDSETWNGGRTPWDESINWPVNNISSGPLTFSWDISNGPHFSDTSDFRYWITKPGFQYQIGQDLKWSDFDDQPFCDLDYNHANAGAYPNIQADEGNAHFYTTCNVPQRSGRHVIYAEWGRNEFTFERFHGCIDVQIGGGGGTMPTPTPIPTATPTPTPVPTPTSTPVPTPTPTLSPTPTPVPTPTPGSSSSVSGQCEELCQWYSEGTYPLCNNQNSGWGWENNGSCIGRSTCSNSNNSGGVVSNCGNPSSTAAASSSSAPTAGGSCNWYGWPVPVCQNTSNGWGNENGRSCVSQSTCNSQ